MIVLPENQPEDSHILIDELFKIINKLPNTVCGGHGSYVIINDFDMTYRQQFDVTGDSLYI